MDTRCLNNSLKIFCSKMACLWVLKPPRMRMELATVEGNRDMEIGKEVHARAGHGRKWFSEKRFSAQFIR